MKEKMAIKHGYEQGDMTPTVESYQKPEKDFAERGFSKTYEYVERQDKHQGCMAKDLNKQAYQRPIFLIGDVMSKREDLSLMLSKFKRAHKHG